MKTKILILIIISICFSLNGNSQSFINGSFESTLGNCDFNISNHAFDSLMSDCKAFGDASQIDIINSSCGYGPAQSGNYFIGLAVSVSLQTDALSLYLDEPLTAGNSYAITFYSEKSLAYATNTVEVGYSTDSTSFGTSIGISPPPVETWSSVSFTFTPTVSCKYITLRTAGGAYGWNFVDNFSITPATGFTSWNASRCDIEVTPNPFSTFTTLTLNGNFSLPCNLEIFTISGQLVVRKLVTDREIRIYKEEIGSGMFLIKVLNNKGEIALKKVISNK